MRFKLNLATRLTDLFHFPRWYIDLNVDDTESPTKRPVVLCLVPISFDVQNARLTHTGMGEEPRFEMSDVIACTGPLNARGLPRWLQNQLEQAHQRRGANIPNHLRDGNGSVDWSKVNLDCNQCEWASPLFRYIPADAKVSIRRDDFEKQRAWIGGQL